MVLKQSFVLLGFDHLYVFISPQRLCNPLGSQQSEVANMTVACSVPSTCQYGSEGMSTLAHKGRKKSKKNPEAEYIARKCTDQWSPTLFICPRSLFDFKGNPRSTLLLPQSPTPLSPFPSTSFSLDCDIGLGCMRWCRCWLWL